MAVKSNTGLGDLFRGSANYGHNRVIKQPKPAVADHNVANRDTYTPPTDNAPVASGSDRVRLQDYNFSLASTYGFGGVATLVIPCYGNVLWVCYSTNLTDVAFFKLGSDNGNFPMQPGQSVAGCYFDKLIITVPVAIPFATMYIGVANDPRESKLRFG
jgi:hypothetical protein